MAFTKCVTDSLRSCVAGTAAALEAQVLPTYGTMIPYCESDCDMTSVTDCHPALASFINIEKLSRDKIYPRITKAVCE